MWGRTSPYVWDGYDKNEIPSNLKLWFKVWENLWEDEYNHFLYRFEPVSLRVVLKNVIDDLKLSIKKQQFPNHTKEQILAQINYAKTVDPIAIELLGTEINHLLKQITSNKPELNDLIQLSMYLTDRLSNETYFNRIFDRLKEEIFAKEEPSIKTLKILSQLLIIEFVEKGFEVGSVIEFPNNTFNKATIVNYREMPVFNGFYWGTRLPLTISENSSIQEKFDFIKALYKAPSFSAKSVFLILGASSKEHEPIKIDNVELSSPLKIELEQDKTKSLWVLNSIEEEEHDKPFLRAIVEGNGIDFYKIQSYGRRETNKCVDFLTYRYSKNRIGRISVSRSWGMLDNNGNVIYQLPDMSEHFPESKFPYNGVDIISMHKDNVEFIENQGRKYGLVGEVLSSNRVSQALHWINKIGQPEYIEEYFMSQWIALEYLVRSQEKIINSMMNFIPAIAVNKVFDQIHLNLHRILRSEVSNGYLTVENVELAKKYGLVRQPIAYEWNYKTFCRDLPEIAKYTGNRYVIKRIEDLLNLNKNKNELIQFLADTKKRIEYELISIYRIRNKIVHSAEYEHEYIIHYTHRIIELVRLILGTITFDLQYFPDRKIDDILLRQKSICMLFLQKMENDQNFDPYDHTFFR